MIYDSHKSSIQLDSIGLARPSRRRKFRNLKFKLKSYCRLVGIASASMTSIDAPWALKSILDLLYDDQSKKEEVYPFRKQLVDPENLTT